MIKNILILISILLFLISCSKKINTINKLLTSKPIQKELIILQQIESNLDKNLTNKEQEKFLLKIARDFKSIKKELKAIKTRNDKVKNAIETQIKLCDVYEQINNEIKINNIVPARKYLKEAEKYYQEFIKIIED